MNTFVIRHKASGKFLLPVAEEVSINNTRLVIKSENTRQETFEFQVIDGQWGYIRHVQSGYTIHPLNGTIHPEDGTNVVLRNERHAGALFAYDEINEHFIHFGGKYVHLETGEDPSPTDETACVFWDNTHYCMKLECISPDETNEKVFIYGKPKLLGYWQVVFAQLDAKAEHTEKLTIKIGRQRKEKTEMKFSIGFNWEVSSSVDAKAGFFDIISGKTGVSTSSSLTTSLMLDASSESTWTEEKIEEREIKVSAGKSVVTWQFVFFAQHHANKALFKSNILADTSSLEEKPNMK